MGCGEHRGMMGSQQCAEKKALRWWVVKVFMQQNTFPQSTVELHVFAFGAGGCLGGPGWRLSFLPFSSPLVSCSHLDGEQLTADDLLSKLAVQTRCCSLSLEAGGGWGRLNTRMLLIIASEKWDGYRLRSVKFSRLSWEEDRLLCFLN